MRRFEPYVVPRGTLLLLGFDFFFGVHLECAEWCRLVVMMVCLFPCANFLGTVCAGKVVPSVVSAEQHILCYCSSAA